MSVDSTGLAPGSYQAFVGIVTDDPDMGVATVRVRLLGDEVRAVRERRRRSRRVPGRHQLRRRPPVPRRRARLGRRQHGADDRPRDRRAPRIPSVFRSQREGMGSYRFTVPNGRYRVQLEFAELAGLAEFGRIMDVFVRGAAPLQQPRRGRPSGTMARALRDVRRERARRSPRRAIRPSARRATGAQRDPGDLAASLTRRGDVRRGRVKRSRRRRPPVAPEGTTGPSIGQGGAGRIRRGTRDSHPSALTFQFKQTSAPPPPFSLSGPVVPSAMSSPGPP